MGVLPRDGGSTEVAHIAWLKIINALVPSLVPPHENRFRISGWLLLAFPNFQYRQVVKQTSQRTHIKFFSTETCQGKTTIPPSFQSQLKPGKFNHISRLSKSENKWGNKDFLSMNHQ